MPLADFYRNLTYSDGHAGRCKECTKAWNKRWYQRKSSTDLEWVLQKRERGRKSAEKYGNKIVTVEAHRLNNLRMRAKYPERYVATSAVSNAIRDGRLTRKPCEVCGKKAQAHHDDYSKPLDVRWLCIKHHHEVHRKIREKELIKRFRQQQLKSKGLD